MIMKSLFALILLLLLVQPAFAQLIPEDIKTISDIVKKENTALETQLQRSVDMKFKGVAGEFETIRFGQKLLFALVIGAMALIVLAVGIPQIIIAHNQSEQETLKAEINMLREKIKLLEQTRLAGPN